MHSYYLTRFGHEAPLNTLHHKTSFLWLSITPGQERSHKTKCLTTSITKLRRRIGTTPKWWPSSRNWQTTTLSGSLLTEQPWSFEKFRRRFSSTTSTSTSPLRLSTLTAYVARSGQQLIHFGLLVLGNKKINNNLPLESLRSWLHKKILTEVVSLDQFFVWPLFLEVKFSKPPPGRLIISEVL